MFHTNCYFYESFHPLGIDKAATLTAQIDTENASHPVAIAEMKNLSENLKCGISVRGSGVRSSKIQRIVLIIKVDANQFGALQHLDSRTAMCCFYAFALSRFVDTWTFRMVLCVHSDNV